jgi:hypothetical protein
MQYWGSVQLLEKEIPREITRTNGFKVAQPSAGLSDKQVKKDILPHLS